MMKQAGLLTIVLLAFPALAEQGRSLNQGQTPIIDVRTESEYRQGRVQGAIHIPYDEIASRINAVAPNRDARIVLYCRSGRRSGIAEQSLRRLGYTQIENKGGLEDMRRAGYPTE